MFRARRALLVAGGPLGVVALALACGPGSIADLTSGRRDAGATVADARGSADAGPACEHAYAPEKPDASDSANVPEIVFALDNIRFDTADIDAGLPKPKGLDVDRTCSCAEAPSCVAATDAGPLSCDDENGRDNVVGPLLATVSAISPTLTPSYLHERIHTGYFSVLISLQKWNGKRDDPEVYVSLLMGIGVDRPGGDTEARNPPAFDGEDSWRVDPSSILDGELHVGTSCDEKPCVGISSDFYGYVRDNVLVGRFANTPLLLRTGDNNVVRLSYTDATLTARISDDGARIDGELAGRLPTSDALALVWTIKDPSTGMPFCKSPASYAVFKAGVCNAADLMAEPGADHSGRSCDAMSAAVGFTGARAKLGRVVRAEITDGTGCPEFLETCGQESR